MICVTGISTNDTMFDEGELARCDFVSQTMNYVVNMMNFVFKKDEFWHLEEAALTYFWANQTRNL